MLLASIVILVGDSVVVGFGSDYEVSIGVL